MPLSSSGEYRNVNWKGRFLILVGVILNPFQHFKTPICKFSISPNSRRLETIGTILAMLFPIAVCILMVQFRYHSNHIFQGSDTGWIQSWINACRTRAALDNPDPGNPATVNQAFNFNGTGIGENEKLMCTTFLRCVLFQATEDYPTYWSSAASILAFIPTIVSLLSNSIEEIVAIADESPALALFLALSSSASFSSRFTNIETPQIFEYHAGYILAAEKSIVYLVLEGLRHKKRGRRESWLENETFHMSIALTALIVCAGGIWYSVWTLTLYGCVVWSCPSKFHISLWVALSQVLVVLNIALRSSVFRIEKIILHISDTERMSVPGAFKAVSHDPRQDRMPMLQAQKPLPVRAARDIIIILRCRRRGWKRWCIQTTSSVLSYALYTFSTVVLASMVLILPVTAIYIVVTFSVAGGMGRLVGYWTKSSIRLGKAAIVFDVPEMHMKDLRERLESRVNWQSLDTELTPTSC